MDETTERTSHGPRCFNCDGVIPHAKFVIRNYLLFAWGASEHLVDSAAASNHGARRNPFS